MMLPFLVLLHLLILLKYRTDRERRLSLVHMLIAGWMILLSSLGDEKNNGDDDASATVAVAAVASLLFRPSTKTR